MVIRIPAFQPGGPGSIPGGIRNFNSYPGIGCVSFVCFLSCAVSGGGPDTVLTTHSEIMNDILINNVKKFNINRPTLNSNKFALT